MFVEKVHNGFTDLVGVALFQIEKPGDFVYPLFAPFIPTLSGFLLDRDHACPARQVIYHHLIKENYHAHALYFFDLASPEDILNEEARSIAVEAGMTWFERSQWQRAIYYPRPAEEGLALIHKRALKDYRRDLRKIQERGTLSWQVIRGDMPIDTQIETFLSLENMGWKQRTGHIYGLYSPIRHLLPRNNGRLSSSGKSLLYRTSD